MLSKGGEGVKTAGRQRSYGVGRKGEESLAFTGNRYTTPVIDEHLWSACAWADKWLRSTLWTLVYVPSDAMLVGVFADIHRNLDPTDEKNIHKTNYCTMIKIPSRHYFKTTVSKIAVRLGKSEMGAT